MNFTLSEEQKNFKKMMGEFAQTNVKPMAIEIDEKGVFPKSTVEKMAKLQLLGIPFPENYGGSNRDYLTFAVAVEELSRVCASTGVILSTHIALCSWPIFTFGTEAQKEKYLIPLAKGEKIGAFCLTEEGTGTDAASVSTTAEDAGDHWVLNGKKKFITNGGEADTYVVIASTDKSLGGKGISAFIVEKGTPGFSAGKEEKKMGIRGSVTREMIFDNCKIPKENLLGQKGKGMGIAFAALNIGRVGISAQALGIAQGALDRSIDYMNQRKQFGKALSEFQGLRFDVAEMASRIEAARLLVYKAACTIDMGENPTYEAAMAKLVASETAVAITTKAIQLHGGYGYIQEYEVERMMRDAKITEIYEGTSEVQKMVIAGSLFKK